MENQADKEKRKTETKVINGVKCIRYEGTTTWQKAEVKS